MDVGVGGFGRGEWEVWGECLIFYCPAGFGLNFFFKRKNYGNICCIAERCLIFMIIEE